LTAAPAWLAAHLSDPSLVLLHVGDPDEYSARHIAGAQLALLNDLSAPSRADTLSLELPNAEQLRTTLRTFGISDQSTVVVYYANDWYSPATRIVFTLMAAGFGERVRLLEGGMPAWVREGRPTSSDPPRAPTAGTLSRRDLLPVVVNAAFVGANLAKPGIALVDARATAFYDGRLPARRGTTLRGHVRGALSLPYTELFDDQGALRSAGELKDRFTKAGIKPGDTVVGYCHVGQQATALLFAARTLGHRVLLYDGSMEDWVNRKLPLVASTSAPSERRQPW
jgi:thiosulfate/3-mercaptopyruvate sulfurtransferase